MRDTLFSSSELPDARPQLQHASGIGGRDDVRPGGIDLLHFLLEQRHGHAGVHDVIDTRAPAAEIR